MGVKFVGTNYGQSRIMIGLYVIPLAIYKAIGIPQNLVPIQLDDYTTY